LAEVNLDKAKFMVLSVIDSPGHATSVDQKKQVIDVAFGLRTQATNK